MPSMPACESWKTGSMKILLYTGAWWYWQKINAFDLHSYVIKTDGKPRGNAKLMCKVTATALDMPAKSHRQHCDARECTIKVVRQHCGKFGAVATFEHFKPSWWRTGVGVGVICGGVGCGGMPPPYPCPFFSLFFLRVTRPKFRFFCPRPPPIWPQPIFRQKPP